MDKEVVECFTEEVFSTRKALDSVVEAVRRPVLRVPYRVTRLWGVTAPALGGQKVIADSFGLSSSAERWHLSDLKGLNPSKEAVQCPAPLVSYEVTSDKEKCHSISALLQESAASSRALSIVRDGIAVVTQLGRISGGIVSSVIWLVEGLRQRRRKPFPEVQKCANFPKFAHCTERLCVGEI